MKNIYLILTFLFLQINFSYAFYCVQPQSPNLYMNQPIKPQKPFVPYCINEMMGTHTCDEWTISNYNSEVESYNYDLQNFYTDADNYVRELQNYLLTAQAYVECEIDILNQQ